MNRRQSMQVLMAGGAILTLAGCDPMPAQAVAAWHGPDPSVRDARLRALSWAMLAASPHNQQPWLADIRQPGVIMLYIDAARLLPKTDPFNRQILIGCGGFLELLDMAAVADGWYAAITLMPEGDYDPRGIDARPYARIELRPGAERVPDSLFAYVRQRRTTRGVYRDATPGTVALKQLAEAATRPGVVLRSTSAVAQVKRISALAIAGLNVEFRTQATWEESARLLRFGSRAIAAEPSGLAFTGPRFWLLRQLGMLAPAKLRDAKGSGPDQVLPDMTAALHSTRAWLWLETASNDRSGQLEAGRAFARTGLAAAATGLALHPQSQVLQEFEQMNTLFAAIHHELGVARPGRVHMLVRVGYAEPPGPSPRLALNAILARPV
jgi:hypothetical protein